MALLHLLLAARDARRRVHIREEQTAEALVGHGPQEVIEIRPLALAILSDKHLRMHQIQPGLYDCLNQTPVPAPSTQTTSRVGTA
ncbi:hypothetical protein SBA3_960028 [Candidatus Sulfopaludibacter sp. SbA3]|nr:hypothetical protein SBA3_960028 [Candidatus Sulfopaludibacter sp. SbA3]